MHACVHLYGCAQPYQPMARSRWQKDVCTQARTAEPRNRKENKRTCLRHMYMYIPVPHADRSRCAKRPKASQKGEGAKAWSHTGSNCGPLACEASVITNYTMRPQWMLLQLKQHNMIMLSQRNLASRFSNRPVTGLVS